MFGRMGFRVAGLLAALCLLAGPAGCERSGSKPESAAPQDAPQAHSTDAVQAAGTPMVRIEAGTFLMGSLPSEPEHDPDESPRHRVTIPRDYYLAATEVTVDQFAAFVKETGYRTAAEREGWCWTGPVNGNYVKSKDATWRDPGYPQAGDHPVACVSYDDSVAYANWLSETDGLAPCYPEGGRVAEPGCTGYRLPTEAEWEYAARAGTTTAFPCGDEKTCIDAMAWHKENGGGHTHPVATRKPNAWGLYDMMGNVWEWVQWTGTYPADGAPQVDPPPAVNQYGNRGGGPFSPYNNMRSAARDGVGPPTHRNQDAGFRLARSVSP